MGCLVLGEHAGTEKIAGRAAVDADDVDRVDADAAAGFMAEVQVANEDVGREAAVSVHQFRVAPRAPADRAAGPVDTWGIRADDGRPVDAVDRKHQCDCLHLFIDAGILAADVIARAGESGNIGVVGGVNHRSGRDAEVGVAGVCERYLIDRCTVAGCARAHGNRPGVDDRADPRLVCDDGAERASGVAGRKGVAERGVDLVEDAAFDRNAVRR
jgi:hypothetical protein